MSRAASLERLRRAFERRARLYRPDDLTAYRLVHGIADGFPGLAMDRFGDVLVIHAESEALIPGPLDEFCSAYVKLHPSKGKPVALPRPAWGEPVDEVVVRENGAAFAIRTTAGVSPGLFIDMREVRAWVRHVASGRRVLNLFAYTCAFGVCAALGGAARVLNLDLSRSYLAWGQDNFRLNGLAVDAGDFVYGEALDWLRRFTRRGELFDLVIVDPPSFSTAGRVAFAVERDYPRLVEAAARVVASQGMLLAATNHGATTDARFEAGVARGLASAGRRGRLVRSWHEPSVDFPVAPGAAPYLKVRALVLE